MRLEHPLTAIHSFTLYYTWHYYYTAIGDMLAIFNSAVNFVIYVLTSPKFRQHLSNICVSRLKLDSTPFEAVVTRLRQGERYLARLGP